MRRELHYTQPLSRAYNHNGMESGILLSNSEGETYLFSKYINVYYDEDSKVLLYDQDYFLVADGAFITAYYTIPEGCWCEEGVIEEIIQLIDRSYYIVGNWNESLVEGTKHFGQKDFLHNYMIIGYDTDQKVFLCVGYTTNGTWDRYEVSYEIYLKACKGFANGNFAVFKEHVFGEDSFHLEMFCNHMREFLDGKTSQYKRIPQLKRCGVNGIRDFLNYQKERIANQKRPHEESFYLLKERSEIMVKRLHFLKEKKGYEIPDGVFENYEALQESYSKLLLLVIKYKMTRRAELGERILAMADENLKKDICYGEELLKLFDS